jgi:hypothetical protein
MELVYIGFLNGFDIENAMAVIKYCMFDIKKITL